MSRPQYPDNKTFANFIPLYEHLEDSRILFLNGAITGYIPGVTMNNPFSSHYITDKLMQLGLTSEDPIFLFVDSVGGHVDDGLMIYDMIKTIPAPVYTIGRNCYSMGTVILSAGEQGYRYVMPNSRTMIHLPSGNLQGNANEIEIQRDEIQKVKNTLIRLLKENGAHKSEEEILKDIDNKDHYMSAQETVEYGIADRIVTTDFWKGIL